VKNFCSAPFVHMYVHSNEGHRVCCMSTESTLIDNTVEPDLKKRWSSKYYKNLRKQMLSDERPEICNKCYSIEDVGGISDRMRFNDLYFNNLKPDIVHGNQHKSPIDLDIRPGNLCNLRCRMCGPVSSSQMVKEIKENKFLTKILGKGDITSSDTLTITENIKFLLSNADKSKRIKFLGGEPTIMPEVDEFLDILIERELFSTPLHITTNCTNGNKRFMDKLSKFKAVSFNYSVDGTGKVVEYIRDPVKFKTINTVIKKYHDIAHSGEISFTLQAYNFFNLPESIEWANSIGIILRPEILRYPFFLSYKTIPLVIRQKRIEMMMKYIKRLSDEQQKRVEPCLHLMYNDTEEYDTKELANATKMFDKSRGQHIKDYIPEIWNIIKEDYDAIQI